MKNKKASKDYVVITGASSGIGYASAEKFAERRYNLILVARRKNRLAELKAKLKKVHPEIDIVLITCDLSIEKEVYKLYDELRNYQLKVLINNAGFGLYGRSSQISLEDVSKMIKLNIVAVTILSTLFVRDYYDVDDAQLINISSRAGYTLVDGSLTYSATKFYVSAFTEGLILESVKEKMKLKIKILAPGATKTEFDEVALGNKNFSSTEKNDGYDTVEIVASHLMDLYDNEESVGITSFEDNTFSLRPPIFKSRMN